MLEKTEEQIVKTADIGKLCSIRIYTAREGKTTVKDGLEQEGVLGSDPSYALVSKRVFNDKGVLEQTTLLINSPHLLRLCRDIIKFYPTVPADFESPFELESPFQMLYHHWDNLLQARDTLLGKDDDEARLHLGLLLDFMHIQLGPDRARVQSMLTKGHISYSLLWTIFRPGSLIYTEIQSQPWLLRLEKTAYEENQRIGKFIEVHCSYTDYDGSNVGRASHVIQILQKTYFAAENPCQVTRLPAFPREFIEKGEELEDRLVERGNKFLSLTGLLVRKYDGLALYLKEPPDDFYVCNMGEWPGVWLPYTETGRIVLDRKTFREDNNNEQVSLSPHESTDRTDSLLCPPYTYGYSLGRKDWCRFHVDYISEIDWNKNAFDSLFIKEDQKALLQALVSSHVFPENARDQALQKGKGLAILLHGSPGSGKTFTAEVSAEATGRALFSTAMGDLNPWNDACCFERRLRRLLQYATIWKAVVLIDEADVFLEARSEGAGDTADRNSLVAVFLRNLEYFSGIVFLTSNRVHVFDQAMKSRIHLALEYTPPNIEMRKQMWVKTFSYIPPAELGFNIEDDIDILVKDEVNGREITNTANTARTLARFKGEKLQRRHLETVMNVRRDFENSIRKTQDLRLNHDSIEVAGNSTPQANAFNSTL